MCGKKYINQFTGTDGYICNCVYIMEQIESEEEILMNIKLDEERNQPVVTYANSHGQPLSRLMANSPDKVHRLFIDYN